MTRLPDWRVRLATHFGLGRLRDYALGVHDCARFSAGAVTACTGCDPIGAVRYATPRGARRALRALGYADHIAAARDLLPEVPVGLLGLGDLAVVETPEGPALSVCGGAWLFLPARPRGLARLPLTDAVRGLRV